MSVCVCEVKDAVPGLYAGGGAEAGELAYSRVPELSQAASAKARQRLRREKHGQQGGELHLGYTDLLGDTLSSGR